MLEKELPKPIKQVLRSLSHIAQEVEMRRALLELSHHFDRWKAAEIDSFELSDRIHEFHNGANREIWLRYNSRVDLRVLVSYAVKEGLIKVESIPADVSPYIKEVLAP